MTLAKRVKAIGEESWEEARAAFTRLMPTYEPGQGIQAFLEANWDTIG